jgi:hypothetical protein
MYIIYLAFLEFSNRHLPVVNWLALEILRMRDI